MLFFSVYACVCARLCWKCNFFLSLSFEMFNSSFFLFGLNWNWYIPAVSKEGEKNEKKWWYLVNSILSKVMFVQSFVVIFSFFSDQTNKKRNEPSEWFSNRKREWNDMCGRWFKWKKKLRRIMMAVVGYDACV